MVRARLQDVAEHAGVSLATASRILNGSVRQPGPQLVERVRASAKELGYVVNAQAQALARSRTGLLGLIMQDISDPYFSSIAVGAQSAAREHDLQLLLASTERDTSVELEAIDALIAHRADAIVVVGTRRDEAHDRLLDEALTRYAKAGGHVVLVGQPLGSARVVRPPNRTGAGALAQELLRVGLRRFAVLAVSPAWATPLERTEAFTQTVRAAGCEVEEVGPVEFSRDGGYAAAAGVADLARRPGADRPCVFAPSDVMAIGLIAGLRERGLHVPDDVLVAGFDDIPTLRDHVPALTTVQVPLREMGRSAVLAAVAELEDNPSLALAGEFDVSVVLRESTGTAERIAVAQP